MSEHYVLERGVLDGLRGRAGGPDEEDSEEGGDGMRDWGYLRVRALALLGEGWKSPVELARELHIDVRDAKALIDDLARRGAVFRDGPLAIAREGRT